MRRPRRWLVAAVVAATLGCGMARRLAALREVEFRLDHVQNLHLAGMDLSRVRSLDALTPAQTATVRAAAAAGTVPADFELIVRAHNPSANQSTAELFAMDWTLVLGTKDTVSGRLERRFVMKSGDAVDVPVRVQLDLAKFYGRDADAMLQALRTAIGRDGTPNDIALRATPYVGTAYGSIRSPQPILIVRLVGE